MTDRAAYLATVARAMSEDELKANVLDAAASLGWLAHHDRPARTGAGAWATHIEGDPGFPDLVLAHPRHGIAFVELKAERGTVRPDQRRWLDDLTNGAPPGVTVAVWRPRDWVDGTIETHLAGGMVVRDLGGATEVIYP